MKCADKEDVAAEEAAGDFDQSGIYDKEVMHMPSGDGTGPQGKGPKSGRGQGACRSGRKDKATGRGAGQGRGAGRGSGKPAPRGQGKSSGTAGNRLGRG
jgi:hypothetical protein